jgi:hypothetical protein
MPQDLSHLSQDRMLQDRTYDRLQQAAEGYVIKQLGQMRKPDDVALDIAHKFGVDYRMAQGFVREIARNRAGSIHARRIPLILMVSLVTLVAGASFLFASAGSLIRFLNGEILMIGWSTLASLGTGIGMVGGGLIGIVSLFKVGD